MEEIEDVVEEDDDEEIDVNATEVEVYRIVSVILFSQPLR